MYSSPSSRNILSLILLGAPVKIKSPGDNVSHLDSSKIIDELGWSQKITLDKGIDLMISWGRKYQDALLDQETSFTLRA